VTARNKRLHAPDRPRGLLEPCAATSGKHGSEEGSAGKRRSLSDYYLAEAAGLEAWLVNARDVRHLPGRGKSDRADCVWHCKLNERGMLRRSFVPPQAVRDLRALTRTRARLAQDQARHQARVEKILLRHEALLLSDGGERPSISLPS